MTHQTITALDGELIRPGYPIFACPCHECTERRIMWGYFALPKRDRGARVELLALVGRAVPNVRR